MQGQVIGIIGDYVQRFYAFPCKIDTYRQTLCIILHCS